MRAVEPEDPAITYAVVLDALPIVAFMARPDGSLSFLSRGWTAHTGNSAQEILERGYSHVLDPLDLERIVAVWNDACAKETPYRDEYRVRFGDGTYRWMLSQAAPLRDFDSARVVGWFGTLTDIDDRRQAEAALREHAEFNQRLIDSSDDCIFTLELDGEVTSLSANGLAQLGVPESRAVTGLNLVDLWTTEEADAVRAAVQAAASGGSGRFTARYNARDDRSYDVVVNLIRNESGLPERLLAVARDVTEQRRTNEALRAGEARHRAFSEAIPGITWSASPQGDLSFVSERWTEFHGGPADAVLGDAWLEALHEDDRETTRDRWHESLATGNPYETQFRVRMADGLYRWHMVRASPVRDERGNIVRWIGVNIDIDDQRRADEAREMFVALVENSSDFIGIGDLDGKAIYVNEAGRDLLEIGSHEDVLKTHVLDYFRPEDRAFVTGEIFAALEGHGRWSGDFRFRNFRTGEPIPVAYNFFRLTAKNGRALGIATVSRDRRERERIESGLRLLSRTGAATLDSLDYSVTLHNIARAFIGEFASYCIVDVIDAQTGWQRTVVHDDPAREAAILDLPEPSEEHEISRAIVHGEAAVVNVDEAWTDRHADRARADAVRALGVRSFITVPVVTPSREIVGALTCALDETATRAQYVAEDVAFVEEVGRRAGASIANARLYERERRIAVELQRASLPLELPVLEGLTLDAYYRPGSDEATIGGDWYDAFLLEDGRVAFTVGDVLGHGLLAAVTMTKLRQAMQSAAMVRPDPNVMLEVADKTLRLLDPDTYATALAAIYDRSAQTLTFASAGHPGPAMRAPDGSVSEHISPGVMLGLGPNKREATMVLSAPTGSTLVFFTDGLVEATHDLDEGHRRLHAALRSEAVRRDGHAARAIVQDVLGGNEARDDVAVVVARIVAPGPPHEVRKQHARTKRATRWTFESNDAAAARGVRHSFLAYADDATGGASIDSTGAELIIGELVGNVERHAPGRVVVDAEWSEDEVVILVTNDGPCFTPQTSPSEDPFAVSGRGLFLVRLFTSSLTVAPSADGGCTVRAAIPIAKSSLAPPTNDLASSDRLRTRQTRSQGTSIT